MRKTLMTFEMTQSATLMRDLLQLLAQKTAVDDTIVQLLYRTCELVGAPSGFYLMFENPNFLVSYKMQTDVTDATPELVFLASQLTDEPHLTSAPVGVQGGKGMLVVPVRLKDKTIGAIFLMLETLETFDDATNQLLLAIADATAVIAREARVSDRHEKLMRNQNEFVRIVSHDLRSPLTSIQGFASMLESNMVGQLNEKQAHYIHKILSGVTQMTSLVENIQDAGRYDPETGFYEMERAPIDLMEIARRVVKNHLLPAEKSELTLTANVSDDIPIIYADGNMIERSMINLVDNAIKYTPNGGHIEVGVGRQDGSLIIWVKDTGLGISKEDLRQLFQRHFRIRRPEHKLVKGSGLGLFIVRSVALRHGGDAFVESVEGEGSTFGISIPLEGENLLVGNLNT
jgi:signal transduction histidine kinase